MAFSLKCAFPKAVMVHGEPSTWSPALVKSLGLIVRGLDTLSSLPAPSVGSFTPSAVRHFEPELIASLSEEQLGYFPPEALFALERSHLENLPASFLQDKIEVQSDYPSAIILKRMDIYVSGKDEEHGDDHDHEEEVTVETVKEAGSSNVTR